MRKKTRIFVGDFETTVYDNQEYTEVWASASVELFTEDVQIFHSIHEQFNYFKSLDSSIIVYYHNLKFDGQFWLSYLLKTLGLKQAITFHNDEQTEAEFHSKKDMKNNSFKYLISDMGQWYSILIKTNNRFIEIRDSYKLLPYSAEKIGKSYQTKHQKLSYNEYKGFRYAGCEITEKDRQYITNDVLVIKEGLEIMFNDGHDKLTIGSCCLAEYKQIVNNLSFNGKLFNEWFPNMAEEAMEASVYDAENADQYIRKSYRGGWCYLVKGQEGKIFTKGSTHDVNSLYPSQMHSLSGNQYPIGYPTFWTGNYIPDEAQKDNRYYFIRIKTRFYIKPNYLPFIQIKGNPFYRGNENLESSDVYDKVNGGYYTHWKDRQGNLHDTRVTLTMTMTDYQLFLEHYTPVDFEILDGCYFQAQHGIFDDYINKYKQIKTENEGAIRETAKLFLNNLYGKLATGTQSSFKVAYLEDNIVKYYTIEENNKTPVYIPAGSAITSYARNFTIRVAQQNYNPKGKGFIYADTDSIHCDLAPSEVKDIKVHPTEFNHWSVESEWAKAIFTRQKTYIELVTVSNGKALEKPYYDVKCAGMPKRSKELFIQSITGEYENEDAYTDEEKEFLQESRTLSDFTIGLKVPSKLLPRTIEGGVILVETTYEMTKKQWAR